jgi:hypothetical protein
MKKIIISLIVIILSVNGFSQDSRVNSKRGTTAATFLSIGQGARALGLGSAYVAVTDDPSALYWNPAGITGTTGFGFVVDHTTWFADINYNFLALTYNLGNFGTIGASFTMSDIGEMNVTTIANPDGDGRKFGVTDAAFSLAWAIQLTDNFSIGFNPKYIYQGIWTMSATSFALDLGVKYVTPFDDAVLAMSISNFGQKMRMQGGAAQVLFDPNIHSTGNNPAIPAELLTESWDLPLTFRVGIAYQPFKIEDNALTLAVDALHLSDNYESVNFGAEYSYNDFVFLRAGYKSAFVSDSEETFALGFGIKQLVVGNIALKVDYAYQDFGRLNSIQKFTFGITF